MKRLLLLLALLALLAGCAPAAPGPLPTVALAPTQVQPTVDPASVVTITFGVQSYDASDYMPLIRTFETENPGVRVRLLPLDDVFTDDMGSDSRLFTLAEQADVALVRTTDVAENQQAGAVLRDLSPLMDADPTFNRADFYPGAFVRANGTTYALAREVDVPLIFYNKTMMAGRGMPSPPATWTWNDVLNTAEQLTVKRGDEIETYGLLGEWGSTREATLGAFSAAGLDLNGDPATLTLDSPAGRQALERLVSLRRSGALYQHPPSANGSISSEEFVALVRDSKVAMWTIDLNLGRPPFEISAAPLPPLPLSRFSLGNSYVISAGSQHPELAWRWLAFLSNQYIDPAYGGLTRATLLPARSALAERHFLPSLDSQSGVSGASAAASAAAQNPGTSRPWATGADVFNALGRALAGESVEAALADAQARLQQASLPQPTPAPMAITVATPPPGAVAPAGATVITFIVRADDLTRFQSLAERFNQENGQIFVQVLPMVVARTTNAEGQISSVYNAEAQAKAADCFRWDGMMNQPEELLLDLQPLMDADPTFPADDYPRQLLDSVSVNSKRYGLPESVSLPRLRYNRSAFESANLGPPQGNWTPDEFLRAAQQLTNKNEGRYGYVASGGHPVDLGFFLRRFDANPVVGSIDSPKAQFTNPKVLAAVRFYLDLLITASPHTRFDGYRRDRQSMPLFEFLTDGRTGMWFDNPYDQAVTQVSYPVGIAPPPFGQSGVSSDDFGAKLSYFISASSPHPQACWQWLRFLSNQPALFTLRDAVPARVSLASGPEFSAQAGAEVASLYAAYREALQRPLEGNPTERSTLGQTSYWADGFWFYQALDRTMQGGDLLKELEDAQFTTEQFINCRRGGEGWLTCARQVDPNYQGFALMFGDGE
ncbi:MAG: extracellular solute-binding protein [Chloroflexaceae bacterium]|nr:extracellular solute-binding protein [Chloroflexaceae bacterium]